MKWLIGFLFGLLIGLASYAAFDKFLPSWSATMTSLFLSHIARLWFEAKK